MSRRVLSRPSKQTSGHKSSVSPRQSATRQSEQSEATIDLGMRRAMIAEAAYYRAERRGFAPGFELEDWVLSESEVEGQIRGESSEGQSIQSQSLERAAATSAELH